MTFGPGEEDEYLDSDFGWAAGSGRDRSGRLGRRRGRRANADGGVRCRLERLVRGAGRGRHRRLVHRSGLAPSGDAQEVYTYSRAVTLLASGARRWTSSPGRSRRIPRRTMLRPPVEGRTMPPRGGGRRRVGGSRTRSGDPSGPAPLASNAWAIGFERSEDGGAMLIGNPHFPWTGELRFSEVQLTTEEAWTSMAHSCWACRVSAWASPRESPGPTRSRRASASPPTRWSSPGGPDELPDGWRVGRDGVA